MMKTAPYYGWLVLAAAAISELLVQGATSYSAGLFVLPLQGEFHISRAVANLSIPILFLGSAIVAPMVGRELDRRPIRVVMGAGAICFGGGLALIAAAPALWVMALGLFLPVAIGFMALGPLTTSALAARWFYRRRGLALGIAAVATSAGGLVVVPLLGLAIRAFGWRMALFCEAGVIAVIVILLAILVLRDSPRAVGLDDHPENQGRSAEIQSRPDGTNWRARDILGSRAFWIPSLALLTISGTCQALVISLVPYGVQLGLPATSAALLITIFSVAAALTKIVGGILADRLPKTSLLVAASVLMILCLVLLCLFATMPALLVSSALAGAALGCVLPAGSALIAAAFGSASFGAAMGWTYVGLGIFSIGAVVFAGSVYDRTHSYHLAFLVFCAIAIAVLAVTLLLGPRRRGA